MKPGTLAEAGLPGLGEERHRLNRTLTWPHLIALGVGAIVGTGIYTLTGVGADRAGPAVIIAFALAGVVCACAALAYTELATLIPVAGSAYTYTRTVLGEGLAWLVGWSLVLEYSLAGSAVAVGWSAYLGGFLASVGLVIPTQFMAGPGGGGYINLPAVMVVLTISILLVSGTRSSATFNIVLVVIKLVALLTFCALAAPAVHWANYDPFMPYGFASHVQDGKVRGVMAAAAVVFFAFFGFDAVSTAAEEARNPGRDLKIGIIGSMAVCTLIYMAVAAVAVGAWPFTELAKSGEPLALVLRQIGHPLAAWIVGAAALVCLPSVILVLLYGQSRVFFAMARDGLLPRRLARVNSRGAPATMTWVTAACMMVIAGEFRLDEIAELSNAGTLTAFISVAICLMVLRVRKPELARVFKAPFPFVVGTVIVIGSGYLLYSLPMLTIIRFLAWNAIGAVVYLAFRSRRRALPSEELS